ncbi:radical SAM protein [Roseospira marina]|uniref:radical SAM protein n=1 Tax=Roseospira marina TaxID=140057 RepID=UPI001478EC0D|nr:radical SAM protein [Roseospira marina]MBB4313573.1 MoaA/NifB/PqqE/SkfB family radical SAM enzyme [Roseospira marina]MBB5086735.1 MoaA/NifB/PqqE/SkfB family radical SAM enzyme [Roseospira marina]
MSRPVADIGPGLGQTRLAIILPSLLCNYDCPYCRIKAKTRQRGEHTLAAWRDALIGIGAPLVHIAGGEPTVLKGFAEFVLGYPAPLRMTTNLWRAPDRWPPGVWARFEYVTLSFHPDHTDFDAFAARAARLLALFHRREDQRPRLACTIVADPRWIDALPDWIERLTALGLDARAQYLNRPVGDAGSTYTAADLARLRALGVPMSSDAAGQEAHADNGAKMCDAGMAYCHIDPRGNAHRCSRDPLWLGNLFDGSFDWLDGPRRCETACTEACDRTFARFTPLETDS